MKRRICPRCGSKDTAKILWGTRAFSEDLEEKLKKKETALGSCCVSDNNPTYHCNKCKKDFGRSTSLNETLTNSIHFCLGGYFGGYHDVTISKTITGALIEYRPPIGAKDATPIVKEILSVDWMSFVSDLYRCYVSDWKNHYVDPDILDGTQWELEIVFEDQSIMKRHGSNAYPPHWKKFISVFKEYISAEIK
mgnify:FL=1